MMMVNEDIPSDDYHDINDVIDDLRRHEDNNNSDMELKDIIDVHNQFSHNSDLVLQIKTEWVNREDIQLSRKKLGVYTFFKNCSSNEYKDTELLFSLFNDLSIKEFLCELIRFQIQNRDYKILSYLTLASKHRSEAFSLLVVEVMSMIRKIILTNNNIDLNILYKLVDLVNSNPLAGSNYFQILMHLIPNHVGFFRGKNYFFQSNVLTQEQISVLLNTFNQDLFQVTIENLEFLSYIVPDDDSVTDALRTLYGNISWDKPENFKIFVKNIVLIRKHFPNHIKNVNLGLIQSIKKLSSYNQLNELVNKYDHEAIAIFFDLISSLTFTPKQMIPFIRDPNDSTETYPSTISDITPAKYLIYLSLLPIENIQADKVVNMIMDFFKRNILSLYYGELLDNNFALEESVPLFTALNLITGILIRFVRNYNQGMNDALPQIVTHFELVASMVFHDVDPDFMSEPIFTFFDNVLIFFRCFPDCALKTSILMKFLDNILNSSVFTNYHLGIRLAIKYLNSINFQFVTEIEKQEFITNYKGVIMRYPMGSRDYFELIELSEQVLLSLLTTTDTEYFTKTFCDNNIAYYHIIMMERGDTMCPHYRECCWRIIFSVIRLVHKTNGAFMDYKYANYLFDCLYQFNIIRSPTVQGRDLISIIASLTNCNSNEALDAIPYLQRLWGSLSCDQRASDNRLRLDFYLLSASKLGLYAPALLNDSVTKILSQDASDMEFLIKKCQEYGIYCLLSDSDFYRQIISCCDPVALDNLILIYYAQNQLSDKVDNIHRRISTFSIPTQQVLLKKLYKYLESVPMNYSERTSPPI